MPEVPSVQRSILLSIKDVFAERILNGEKTFELRKSVPRDPFDTVYLHVSNGGGVVGCFDVKAVHRLPPHELWRVVGRRATTKARFDDYFGDRASAVAIEVGSTCRFLSPVYPDALKALEPQFIAPQSFLHLDNLPIIRDHLAECRRIAETTSPIRFRPLQPSNESRFKEFVTTSISTKYDDIDATYAESLIKSYRRGRDTNGLLTTRKEILELIVHDTDDFIGFLVLTYKEGGSVKTGPMLLFEQFQNAGYGRRTKFSLIGYLRDQGVRKTYCTCPASDTRTVRYLLRSGYRIEAHLVAHYRQNGDELVFGRMVRRSLGSPQEILNRPSLPAAIDDGPIDLQDALEFCDLLHESWLPVPREGVKRLIRAAASERDTDYNSKPVYAIGLRTNAKLCSLLFVIPKRGGPTKLLLSSGTSHTPSLHRMFSHAEAQMKLEGRRKAYILHPMIDHSIMRYLLGHDYQPEGVIGDPYFPDTDVACLSKFL